jgi:preprotein translocase subunit SecG
MNVLFSSVIIVVCVMIVLIVLVQNSKGGGLASNFASSNQYMGVRKTADFLEKATWTLAGALLFFCLISSITIKNKGTAPKSAIENVNSLPDAAGKPIPFPMQTGDKKADKTSSPAKTTSSPEQKPQNKKP